MTNLTRREICRLREVSASSLDKPWTNVAFPLSFASSGNFACFSEYANGGYDETILTAADIPLPNEHIPTIRDLYPHLSEEQLKEAEEHFERYLELVLRIYERIRLDPEAYENFQALTAPKK